MKQKTNVKNGTCQPTPKSFYITNQIPVLDEQIEERLRGECVGLVEGLDVMLGVGDVADLRHVLLPLDALVALLDHVQVFSCRKDGKWATLYLKKYGEYFSDSLFNGWYQWQFINIGSLS